MLMQRTTTIDDLLADKDFSPLDTPNKRTTALFPDPPGKTKKS
jgi:hypothetical protein